MVNKLKNMWKFFGCTNAHLADSGKYIVVSRVNRKNPMYYLMNVIIVIASLIFILLFIAFLFGKGCFSNIMLGGLLTCFFYILYFGVRLKEGDTIVATEDGIVELNWLFSQYIKWSDIIKVYFYNSGEYLRRLPGLKEFNWTWTNIKIKGRNQTIRINTAYSNYEQLQEYIKKQCIAKISEGKFEPLYFLVGLIAALAGILGAMYLPRLRELIK